MGPYDEDVLALIAMVQAVRSAWRFCTLTEGCTKEDGHQPPCTVYSPKGS